MALGFLFDLFTGDRAKDAQVDASRQSAETAREIADKQLGFLRETRDQTRADQEPFRQAGVNALSQLTNNPLANFQASPDYQFRMTNGLDALSSQFAAGAGNGLRSGAAVKALEGYRQNLAGDEFGDWWNRRAGLAGVGQTANASNQQAGQTAAVGSNNALAGLGNALGSSYQNQADARSGFWGGVSGSMNQYSNMLMKILGGL